MIFLANAISGAMLTDLIPEEGLEVRLSKPTTEQVIRLINDAPEDTVESVIGHKDVATVMGNMLGMEVPFNRVSIKLKEGDVLVWAQMDGPRLPEGATTLPPDTKLTWMMLQV